MKKVLCAVVCAFVLALAIGPVASAHPDYRPWKKAMMAWDTHYSMVWFDLLDEAKQNGTFSGKIASYEFPPGAWMKVRANKWDEGAMTGAQFITAIEGPFPNRGFTAELRAILRPYLGQWNPWRGSGHRVTSR
jgi:hypothetical protein